MSDEKRPYGEGRTIKFLNIRWTPAEAAIIMEAKKYFSFREIILFGAEAIMRQVERRKQ